MYSSDRSAEDDYGALSHLGLPQKPVPLCSARDSYVSEISWCSPLSAIFAPRTRARRKRIVNLERDSALDLQW